MNKHVAILVLIVLTTLTLTVGYSEEEEHSNFTNVSTITCFIWGKEVHKYEEVRESYNPWHKKSILNIFKNK